MIRRAMLTTALACAAVFQSCQSTIGGEKRPSSLLPSAQRAPDEAADWYFKGGLYFGSARVDDIGESLDGYSGGGRLEVGKVLDPETGHFEVGGRISLGGTWADGAGAAIPGGMVDYDGRHVYIEPVFRGYFTTSGIRPYLEAFVGYGYSDFEADGPTLDIDDEVGGLTYGGGLGVEFPLTTSISGPLTLAIGLELRETTLDTKALGDLDEQNVMGTFMFGTRW